jgi:hypothetical protein
MKTYWESEGWLHSFLTLALDGGEWLVSRPGRINPKKISLYPPDRRLVWSQSQSGRRGEGKKFLLSFCRDWNLGRPTHSHYIEWDTSVLMMVSYIETRRTKFVQLNYVSAWVSGGT